ncbi:hypothetical protein J7L49_06480 [Candidatus Bathyarchaeota archaeon]|nr:hypothetical protein [Candidatus Bathyarchaeota archaeon]
MKAEAVVRLNLPSEKFLEVFLKALEPEVKKPPTIRSKAKIEGKGKKLILRIESRDTTALRASINAYLRWINSMLDVLKVLGQ